MIDLYCERLSPGIWAEPINALTNLAFLVAAFAAWRLTDQYRSLSVTTELLKQRAAQACATTKI